MREYPHGRVRAGAAAPFFDSFSRAGSREPARCGPMRRKWRVKAGCRPGSAARVHPGWAVPAFGSVARAVSGPANPVQAGASAAVREGRQWGGVGVATFGLGGSVLRRVRAGCVWRADPVRAYASAAAGPDRRRGCIRAGRVRPSAPSRGLRLGRPARCSPARRRRRALRGARAPASRRSGRRASGEPCGLRRSGRSSRSRASCPSRSRARG